MSPDGEVILHFRVKGVGWAEIYLTATGQLTSQSDYGVHAHWWSPPKRGDRMAEFLKLILWAKKDRGYFITKLAQGQKDYDGRTTLREIKKRIIELRTEGRWDREKAREEWDLLESCGIESHHEDFAKWMDSTTMEEPWEYSFTMPPPQTVAFVERVIIPKLVPAIERYLENPQHDRRI